MHLFYERMCIAPWLVASYIMQITLENNVGEEKGQVAKSQINQIQVRNKIYYSFKAILD